MLKMAQNMTENKKEIGLTRHGKTIYKTNPSVVGSFPLRMKAKRSKNLGDAYMVAPGTGEVVAKGSFNFVEEIEVDEAQFVKVYLDGIKQHAQLGKAGTLLFELVYHEMSGVRAKDKDTVMLNYFLALDWRPELSKRTYERGMSELLEKGFLFRSVAADMYFVNIRFMFNGSRQNIIKSYYIKGSKKHDDNQLDLFASTQDALSSSEDDK
jgi:hypothetical protein